MSIARKIMTGDAGGSGDPEYDLDDVFSTYLYEGTGKARDIVNGIDLVDKGGLVWIKNRSSGGNAIHFQWDTERQTPLSYISSDRPNAEYSNLDYHITSFNSDGFSLHNSGNGDNARAEYYASWTWAKQDEFFDVVTYTGNGVAGRKIPHNLGSAPGMIIVKCLTDTKNWRVYHTSLGANYWLELNETSDKTSSLAIWNRTEPTSTSFTVGSSSTINGSDQEYVAYLFADNPLSIRCGSYVGNASDNGPEIYLGWEPQWLLIKDADGANNWVMLDVMRGIVTDGNDPYLQPNTQDSETGNLDSVDVNATGFKIKTSSGMFNGSFKTHIYMAIRRPVTPAE